LAEAVGGRVEGHPKFAVRATDFACDVPDGHIGIVPISPSGEVREWSGWRELADELARPVVFYGGPGEHGAVARVAGPHRQIVGLPLPAFAATLRRCAVLLSNDSGPAHFARAAGVPAITVFGSTTAARTGAPGAVAVEGPPMACRPCYGRRCKVGGVPCLDIPIDSVRRALDEVLGG
jgi:ADP-heptose:LPS heptosyltransferase